jgi:hypothetical protein
MNSVFLDIQAVRSILKALVVPQPLTSIQEAPNGETRQNGQVLVLMAPFAVCRTPLACTWL